jgi:hypothetical protein
VIDERPLQEIAPLIDENDDASRHPPITPVKTPPSRIVGY